MVQTSAAHFISKYRKKEKRHAYAVGLTNSSHSKCMTLFELVAGAGFEPIDFRSEKT